MAMNISIDKRIEDIRNTLGKVSPYSNTRLLVHLMPLVEEIERLRLRSHREQSTQELAKHESSEF